MDTIKARIIYDLRLVKGLLDKEEEEAVSRGGNCKIFNV